MNALPRSLIFFNLILGIAALQAQVVDQLISPESLTITGGNVIIVFDDMRADTSETEFQVEHSDNVTQWIGIANSSVDPHPSIAHRFTLTAPEPPGERKFYRIIGYTTEQGVDNDGDGLSNTFEGTNGTDPDVFDSDNDGFGDGFEFQYGTDPNLPGSYPMLTSGPKIEFQEATSERVEGEPGGYNVTIVSDQPITGSIDVNIKVGIGSTAMAGMDFVSLPSTVSISGSSATQTITWIDDTNISPLRLLMLEIEQGTGYLRGGQTRHIIVLRENDAWWSGMLVDKYAQRNFRMKITYDATGSVHSFVAGAGNDGLPVLDSETVGSESSVSVGIIPDGDFPATITSDTPTHFEIASPPLPAATAGLFGASAGLARTLTLASIPNATPPNENAHEISTLRMIGDYTECLALPGQANCAEQTGTFVMVKDLQDPPVTITTP